MTAFIYISLGTAQLELTAAAAATVATSIHAARAAQADKAERKMLA